MSSFKIPRDIDTLTIDLSEHDRQVRNKAIDEFKERLLEELSHTTLMEYGYYLANIIKPLAEQLKAGGENES